MDNRIFLLYLFCSFAGLIMVGGGIWLIYKEKIYIDQESKQITEIETPFGKFKTNIPALALFILGFFPLIYPLYATSDLLHIKQVTISGMVRASVHPVLVHAIIGSDPLLQDRPFRLNVPLFDSSYGNYKIIYIAGNIVMEEMVDLNKAKGGIIELSEKDLHVTVKKYEPNIPVKEIPSEFKGGGF
jgi:hypothetical protein